MSTPKPATPLPWTVAQAGDPNNVPRIMSPAGGVAVLCINRFMGDKGPSKDELQQAAYIVAACNAYPRLVADRARLVEALRDAIPALILLGNYIGNDWKGGGGIEAFDRCAIIGQARALLREIGEDASCA